MGIPRVHFQGHNTEEQTFHFVLQTLLGHTPAGPMYKAMDGLDYDEINDLATMSEDEVLALQYPNPTGTLVPVSMKACKRLLLVLMWRDHLVQQQTTSRFTATDWLALSPHDFDIFRLDVAPNLMSRGDKSSVSNSTSTSQTCELESFKKGHKRDMSNYVTFNGDRRQWFKTKRSWTANAATDGIAEVIDAT